MQNIKSSISFSTGEVSCEERIEDGAMIKSHGNGYWSYFVNSINNAQEIYYMKSR